MVYIVPNFYESGALYDCWRKKTPIRSNNMLLSASHNINIYFLYGTYHRT